VNLDLTQQIKHVFVLLENRCNLKNNACEILHPPIQEQVMLGSDKGKLIYSHRMSVVEPVFGNIGTNKGFNKFNLRSKQKVQNQFKLFCIIHNIEKIKNYDNIVA